VNTKQKGSSLIESLIVVAIVLIIAAIAIPNLHRLRIAANEASVGSMRTMNTAANTYGSTYGNGLPPKPCVYRREGNRGRRLPQCLLA